MRPAGPFSYMADDERTREVPVNIIIVGCGRVGASLGKMLCSDENDVAIVDVDENAFNRLGSEYQGRTVVGQGFDEDVLIQAGIGTCDAFAAVTSSDNVNLMASEVARRLYRVPHVITRLINPDRLGVYKQLGLDYICDTELVAEGISAMIRSRRAHHLDTFGEYEVLTFTLETPKVLHVRDIEGLGDIEVTLLGHDDEVVRAAPNMFLHDGDAIIAVVHESALPVLAPYMKD